MIFRSFTFTLHGEERKTRDRGLQKNITDFLCDEFVLKKLSIIFREKLDWREAEVFPDEIRKLGFKNS